MVRKSLLLKPKILKLCDIHCVLEIFQKILMVSSGLAGYVYDFSVDYWAIANDKILEIHNYLMKKNNIV